MTLGERLAELQALGELALPADHDKRGIYMATTYLSDEERQELLRLIDAHCAGADDDHPRYASVIALRRKLEGVDKRVAVEDGKT